MFSPINALPIAASHSGETFLAILPYAMLAGVVLIVAHAVASPFFGEAGPRKSWRWWESLVYLGVVAIIVWLGVTSFVGMFRLGAVGGWWLFAHMGGSGALVAALPLLALMWADANRFCVAGAGEGEAAAPAQQFLGLAKVAFWTILVSGLVVIGTMIVSMLPWLGSQGQHWMLDVHRYAGLVCVVAAGIHLYAVLYFAARRRR